ncbi:MAG: hypothetical protein AB8G99_00360 [Planctomycetaceae bacterium]
MSWAPAQKSRMLLLLMAFASTTFCGCAMLFNKNSGEELTRAATNVEPAIHRDAICLDIAVADRPATDSLVALLWDDVDEIGVLEAADKRLLNANGFRIGVAGSSVPSSLQTILQEAVAEQGAEQNWSPIGNQLPGSSKVTLFNKQDTLFEVTQLGELAYVEVDENGDPISDPESFNNSRCVVRLTAEKMQDGWIKLRFLPEVHHGANANRPTVGDAGFQYKQSQRMKPLYQYQFEVTLNPGEIAVVGGNEADEHTLGQQFFNIKLPTGFAQKIITVRFVETANLTASRTE